MRSFQILFVIALAFQQVLVHANDFAPSFDPSDAPQINNFTCKYDNRVMLLSWQPQEVGKNISHYRLEYSTTFAPDEWTVFQEKVTKTSYVVVQKPGITFNMRVVTIYKDRNSSQPSEPSEFCETKPDVPYVNPEEVQVYATPPNDLLVTWTPISQMQHNGPGLFYRVYYRRKTGLLKWNVTTITDWKQGRFVITNLPDGMYEVLVKAGNSLGMCGAIPQDVVGYPRLYAPYLSYFICQEKQADIFWIHRGITDNFDSYSIQYNTAYAKEDWTTVVDNTDSKFHVVPLQPGQTYSFRVVAKYTDIKPEQASAHTQLCTTKPDVPYMNPSNVYVKGGAPNELVINWTPLPQIEHNGPGFFYRVYWRKQGEDWNQSETITNWKKDIHVLQYSHSVQKLEIKVVAGNDMGESKVEPVVLKV